jgi:hypothetical protein
MEDSKTGPSSGDWDGTDEERSSPHAIKKGRNGIVLVPHPSDDPRDPLVCLLIALIESGRLDITST